MATEKQQPSGSSKKEQNPKGSKNVKDIKGQAKKGSQEKRSGQDRPGSKAA